MVRYVSLCNLTQSIEETETWADGINAENHLPTFTRNVRLVPRYSFSPFQ